MRPVLIALPLAVLSVVASPTHFAFSQDVKIARGTVNEVGVASVTVQVRDVQMRFSIDRKTRIDAPGAESKAHEATARGKTGPHLTDILKVGQAVAVTYQDKEGTLLASAIRVVPSPGAGGGSVSEPPVEMVAIGTVTAVGARTLTITGSGSGGASFTQTYVVDAKTTVVAKGASTTVIPRGGRVPLNELISNGDKVKVSYHKSDGALHASDVRITMKGSH